jgi:transcriptional antiterminator RfaH
LSILSKERDIFPDELLTEGVALTGDRQWWTLYTRARQEKSLARELLARKIPFYLPLIERFHLYKGRKRSSYVPLLTTYIFLFASEEERIRALSTNRIVQVLAVPDSQQLLHDLQQIQRLIAANVPLTVERRLQPGQRIRVRDGALAGIEGIVYARSKRTKLVVLLHMLQQGVSVEVDDFLLEPID